MTDSINNTKNHQQKMNVVMAQNASVSIAQVIANVINEERWQVGCNMYETASLVSRVFMLGEMAKYEGLTVIRSEELAYDMTETAWKIINQYRQSLYAGQIACRMDNDWPVLDARIEALILSGFCLVAYPVD